MIITVTTTLPMFVPSHIFPFPCVTHLKSLYGCIIHTPNDLTLCCSAATPFALPNIRSENLLTPGCSKALNCLWRKVDWSGMTPSSDSDGRGAPAGPLDSSMAFSRRGGVDAVTVVVAVVPSNPAVTSRDFELGLAPESVRSCWWFEPDSSLRLTSSPPRNKVLEEDRQLVREKPPLERSVESPFEAGGCPSASIIQI